MSCSINIINRMNESGPGRPSGVVEGKERWKGLYSGCGVTFGNSWKYSSTAMHQRKAQWVPQKIFKVKVFDNVGLEERL